MKKITFKNVRRDFLDGKLKLEKYEKICGIFLIVVFSGFVGWAWEFFFDEMRYRFDRFYIKGGNLLPWINLYAFGALLVLLVSKKLRRRPILLFFVTALSTGLLELLSGWLVFTLENGERYWDYRNVWWGFGNINGFVCPGSAVVFGIGSMIFIYLLAPICFFIVKKLEKRKLLILSITLFTLVLLDETTNLTLRLSGKKNAVDFYHSLGWEYKPK